MIFIDFLIIYNNKLMIHILFMNTTIHFPDIINFPDILNYVSLFASLFAVFIILGYWARPRLKFCIYIEKDKWKVKVINSNFLRTSVKDLQCEMAISINESFTTAHTLELEKDWIVFIKACHDSYTFKIKKTIQSEKKEKEYKYLRVRLLAPNFIGVKKAFEKIFDISNITEGECDPMRHN